MDHAIRGLKDYMNATIGMRSGMSRKEVAEEMRAYVKSLNVLEKHYYGEPVTKLDSVLENFKEG